MLLLLFSGADGAEPEEVASTGTDGSSNRRRRLYLGPEKRSTAAPAAVVAAAPVAAQPVAAEPAPAAIPPSALAPVLRDMLARLAEQQAAAEMQAAQEFAALVEAEDDDERATMAAVEMLMQ
jgi:hypothetical protein